MSEFSTPFCRQAVLATVFAVLSALQSCLVRYSRDKVPAAVGGQEKDLTMQPLYSPLFAARKSLVDSSALGKASGITCVCDLTTGTGKVLQLHCAIHSDKAYAVSALQLQDGRGKQPL